MQRGADAGKEGEAFAQRRLAAEGVAAHGEKELRPAKLGVGGGLEPPLLLEPVAQGRQHLHRLVRPPGLLCQLGQLLEGGEGERRLARGLGFGGGRPEDAEELRRLPRLPEELGLRPAYRPGVRHGPRGALQEARRELGVRELGAGPTGEVEKHFSRGKAGRAALERAGQKGNGLPRVSHGEQVRQALHRRGAERPLAEKPPQRGLGRGRVAAGRLEVRVRQEELLVAVRRVLKRRRLGGGGKQGERLGACTGAVEVKGQHPKLLAFGRSQSVGPPP